VSNAANSDSQKLYKEADLQVNDSALR